MYRATPSSSSGWSSDDHTANNFNYNHNQYDQPPNHHEQHLNNANNFYYQNHHNSNLLPPDYHNYQPELHPQHHNLNRPNHQNHQPDYHHQFHMNGEQNAAVEGGGGFKSNSGNYFPHSGRKRFRHSSNSGSSSDVIDAASQAKLYVAQVPRTATEELIRPLFEQHGTIVEIVILKDKRTGQQQGSCFVKYSMADEADRAIKTLDNQYTFPGENGPINVRYADGEKERLGVLDKLYVGGLNKDSTKREIEEIFSPHGLIEDIYIVRDRGCGFVKFAHRDMAAAAIRALNGIVIPKVCEQPMIVRFADPKKPKNGEPRGNNGWGSFHSGPRPQETLARAEPAFGSSWSGYYPNNSYPVTQMSTSSQLASNFPMPNHGPSVPITMQHPFTPLQEIPSQSSHISIKHTEIPVFQSAQPALLQSTKDPNQQHGSQANEQQSSLSGSTAQIVISGSDSLVMPQKSPTATSLECDWSEHTCPDGCKYYYNCATYESQWEKPEQLVLFEHQLHHQHKAPNPSLQTRSLSTLLSVQEVQLQTQFIQNKLQLEQPSSSSTPELDRVLVQSKSSPVISPTCA